MSYKHSMTTKEIKKEIKDDYKKFFVFHRDMWTLVSWSLVASQGVDDESLKKILKAHKDKMRIFYKMEETDESSTLKVLNGEIKKLEFKLQSLWGFPQDVNFHRFWEVPKCQCPEMDNEDAYPTGYYVISGGCPIHGMELGTFGCSATVYEKEEK